jgi:hypothetical protein
MLKIELYSHDSVGDPLARFATDAEIEIADQLRMPRAVWRRFASSSEQSEA